ncbi:sulfatase family protein [Cystobacter ferrugineus]|uniref:sulfatase family protein n=1 Tax=Cystobacter ferrugineus TaxID=83449 RepID=UPI000B1A9B6A|nr:sulfatase [Cystobacter ferrugineus]
MNSSSRCHHSGGKPPSALPRWGLANACFFAAAFVVSSAIFTAAVCGIDNELATQVRREYLRELVWANVALLPGYAVLCAAHTLLSWPLERRRLARGTPPGAVRPFSRSLLAALFWNLALCFSSLGPIALWSTGNLDALVRSLDVDLYWLIERDLHVALTGIMLLLVLFTAYDAGCWVARTARRWPRAALMTGGLAVGLLVLGTAWPAWRGTPLPRARRERPHILILGSDALRADHLGTYGYPRPTSPHIDRLARESVTFEQHHSVTPSTTESWTSTLTGLYPIHTGIRYMFVTREQAERISAHPRTLPRILRERGYETFVSGDGSANNFASVDLGFDQTSVPDDERVSSLINELLATTHPLLTYYLANPLGERLLPAMKGSRAALHPGRITADFLEELDRTAASGQPFLGLLFLRFTHPNYDVGYPYNKRFTDAGYRGKSRFSMQFDPDDLIQGHLEGLFPPAERRHIVDLYDGGVSKFDDTVGQVVEHLERTGLARDTILVITSDHGEALFQPDTALAVERNFFGGDQLTHIPLVIRMPDRRWAGARVRGLSRTIDLMPTLLELSGGPGASPAVDGVSLVGLIQGSQPGRPVYAETGFQFYPLNLPGVELPLPERVDRMGFFDPSDSGRLVLRPSFHDAILAAKHRMVRTARWKLIYLPARPSPVYQLYDLSRDPSQREDLSGRGLPVFGRLVRHLDHWMETGEELPWSDADDAAGAPP